MEFVTERVLYIKGLKSPTEQQKMLVELSEKPELNVVEKRTMDAILRAEKALKRVDAARANADRLISKIGEDPIRKARNHRLIQQGLLIDKAGLQDKPAGAILALLTEAKNADPTDWANWTVVGNQILAESGELK